MGIKAEAQLVLVKIYEARMGDKGLNGTMTEIDDTDPGFWASEENIEFVTVIGEATEPKEVREKAERLRFGKRN